MVAAAAGAKGVAIGILDEYYDVKHKSLLDLGTGWTYVSAKTSSELPEPQEILDLSRLPASFQAASKLRRWEFILYRHRLKQKGPRQRPGPYDLPEH